MCLDIDPDSVIHEHLVKKITTLNEDCYTDTGGYDTGFETLINPIINRETDRIKFNKSVIKHGNSLEDCYAECESEHNLTMLPSFHISLEAPLEHNESKPNSIHLNTLDVASLVGWIALAPINISKKDDKKSAWVPLYPTMFRLMQQNNVLPKYINLEPFHSIGKELHISLANLTGEPRDNIARPEDCIVDTINN